MSDCFYAVLSAGNIIGSYYGALHDAVLSSVGFFSLLFHMSKFPNAHPGLVTC
jgi:hypothetical protein